MGVLFVLMLQLNDHLTCLEQFLIGSRLNKEIRRWEAKEIYADLLVFCSEFVDLILSLVEIVFVLLLKFFQGHFQLSMDLLTVVVRRSQRRLQISIDATVRLDLL